MEGKEMEKKEILTGKNIVDALLEIIREAKEKLVIVSPFIKLDNLNDDLKKTIEELLEAKSKIIELHTRPEYYEKGEKRNTVEELSKIFKGICPEHIYYNKKLHAKLYFNEKKALITSLNLLDYSIENSIELGYLIDDIDECKKIKEQFYEKYLIEPYKEIEKNIDELKNVLNNKYDTFRYDHNKITIENKKGTNIAFILECSYDMLMDDNHYSLQFKITVNDENFYSQVQQNFQKQFNGYRCPIINYEADNNGKFILFSSDIIDTDKEPNAVFKYDDIRNVFCNRELNHKFFDYINRIMKTLRAILYKK